MQKIAKVFPPVYVFESMRKILIDNQIEFQALYKIVILNLFYLILSVLFFENDKSFKDQGITDKSGGII